MSTSYTYTTNGYTAFDLSSSENLSIDILSDGFIIPTTPTPPVEPVPWPIYNVVVIPPPTPPITPAATPEPNYSLLILLLIGVILCRKSINSN